MDGEFPRAVRYCIRCASESLHAITGTPIGAFYYTSEQLMGQLRAELDFTSVDQRHPRTACTSTSIASRSR